MSPVFTLSILPMARAHVAVAHLHITHETGLERRRPVGEDAEIGAARPYNVAVSGIEDVAVHEAVLVNLVVAEALVDRGVDDKLRCEVVEYDIDVMGFLHVEVGITIGERGRIGPVAVRIEVADARTRYAHGIRSSEICRRGDTPREAAGGNEVAVVAAEVVAGAMDDMQSVANAFLALYGMLGTTQGDIDEANRTRVLSLAEGGRAEFVVKDLNHEALGQLENNLSRQVYM